MLVLVCRARLILSFNLQVSFEHQVWIMCLPKKVYLGTRCDTPPALESAPLFTLQMLQAAVPPHDIKFKVNKVYGDTKVRLRMYAAYIYLLSLLLLSFKSRYFTTQIGLFSGQ
jgi:hypothetical protein